MTAVTVSYVIAWRPDTDPIHVSLVLRYDATRPYEVTMEVTDDRGGEPVEWVFARELLADGLHDHAGTGDVLVRHTADRHVVIDLHSTFGRCSLKIPAEPVREFVADMHHQVLPGRERPAGDVDAELAAILEEGAS